MSNHPTKYFHGSIHLELLFSLLKYLFRNHGSISICLLYLHVGLLVVVLLRASAIKSPNPMAIAASALAPYTSLCSAAFDKIAISNIYIHHIFYHMKNI